MIFSTYSIDSTAFDSNLHKDFFEKNKTYTKSKQKENNQVLKILQQIKKEEKKLNQKISERHSNKSSLEVCMDKIFSDNEIPEFCEEIVKESSRLSNFKKIKYKELFEVLKIKNVNDKFDIRVTPSNTTSDFINLYQCRNSLATKGFSSKTVPEMLGKFYKKELSTYLNDVLFQKFSQSLYSTGIEQKLPLVINDWIKKEVTTGKTSFWNFGNFESALFSMSATLLDEKQLNFSKKAEISLYLKKGLHYFFEEYDPCYFNKFLSKNSAYFFLSGKSLFIEDAGTDLQTAIVVSGSLQDIDSTYIIEKLKSLEKNSEITYTSKDSLTTKKVKLLFTNLKTFQEIPFHAINVNKLTKSAIEEECYEITKHMIGKINILETKEINLLIDYAKQIHLEKYIEEKDYTTRFNFFNKCPLL